jgi:hypothetical protein
MEVCVWSCKLKRVLLTHVPARFCLCCLAADGLHQEPRPAFGLLHQDLIDSLVPHYCTSARGCWRLQQRQYLVSSIAYLFLLIDSQNAQLPDAEPISRLSRHDEH